MKKGLFFTQEKPFKVKILGVLIFVIIGYLLIKGDSSLSQVLILLSIGITLLGYSISYEVKKGFDVYRHFMFLGGTIYKAKTDLDFPEYISVFSASFKQDNEWGTVSALGTQAKQNSFVIRLFNGNNRFTLFKTSNYQNAIGKANQLSELLGVEIHDATKP
ncbi:hypothetical protein [uncultured Aquimarina sp.]|uniref:hypothetical protein n=1 Tax=uncultured Aquimarina sp. TaxID=575652 RepID=UPI0026284E7A|nr:hypothetical protein [uncultured Aquimarina sp.]